LPQADFKDLLSHHSNKKPHHKAKDDCERRGGSLASIANEIENADLLSEAASNGVHDFWINLKSDVVFVWESYEKDGEVVESQEIEWDNWRQGEPRVNEKQYNICSVMGRQGYWNVAGRCNEERSYVC